MTAFNEAKKLSGRSCAGGAGQRAAALGLGGGGQTPPSCGGWVDGRWWVGGQYSTNSAHVERRVAEVGRSPRRRDACDVEVHED